MLLNNALWQIYTAGNNKTYVGLHGSARRRVETKVCSFADALL